MRQMGGGYLYSFDIAALLFGACLNLAGLPYSAGFLGKEFLLFQLFRDDFISTLVRGCWMVSFFFTPIYMLILVFIVAFGPKKSTLQTYSTFWEVPFTSYLQVFKKNAKNITLTRFQYSIITSRATIYLLFAFWIFFFFFGELLLLLTFNYNSLSDIVPSNYFTMLKQHIIFLTSNSNQYLGNVVFFYIIFFTTASLKFLFNLRYTCEYNHYKVFNYIDFVVCTVFLYSYISI